MHPTFPQFLHWLPAIVGQEGGENGHGPEPFFLVYKEKDWKNGFKFKNTLQNQTDGNSLLLWD